MCVQAIQCSTLSVHGSLRADSTKATGVLIPKHLKSKEESIQISFSLVNTDCHPSLPPGCKTMCYSTGLEKHSMQTVQLLTLPLRAKWWKMSILHFPTMTEPHSSRLIIILSSYQELQTCQSEEVQAGYLKVLHQKGYQASEQAALRS